MSIDEILAMNQKKEDADKALEKRLIFRSIGTDDNGIGFVAAVPTISQDHEKIVASLKEHGFKYHGMLKAWVSSVPSPDIKSTTIDFNKYIEWGRDKRYHLMSTVRFDIVKEMLPNMEKANCSDEFVGKIGERVCLEVKVIGGIMVPSNSDFGDLQLLHFEDMDGHRISWLQRQYSLDTVKMFMSRHKTNTVMITGTVKQQVTRYGTPITDLTRCEIETSKGYNLRDFALSVRDRNEKKEQGSK